MQKLVDLLDKYNLSDDVDLPLLETEIWQKYGAEGCVFILDMSGFTQTVHNKGIVHYLSMVRKMQLAAAPIIERYKGEIVKYQADNIYAIFESVRKAVDAAIALNMAINAMNIVTGDDKDIFVGIGISYGKYLYLKGEDYFGDPVNKACKLGEDFAQSGEILLTEEALQQLENKADYQFEEKVYSVSALMIRGYKVIY